MNGRIGIGRSLANLQQRCVSEVTPRGSQAQSSHVIRKTQAVLKLRPKNDAGPVGIPHFKRRFAPGHNRTQEPVAEGFFAAMTVAKHFCLS